MMWLLLGLFLALAFADPQACSTTVAPGALSYTVGSTATTGYLIQAGGTGSGSWGPVSTSGSQITIGKGPRFYLANSCASAFSATVFSAFKILGGSITFTVDLSHIGCGLNAAFYLVSMPASSSGQSGDYYCDANSVGGVACSEMDLFEANRHAIQITPHRCTSSTSCDANGCAKNTQTISKGFGPDSTYTINSLSPFTVQISFTKGSDGMLSGITSVICQTISSVKKSITLTHGSECGSGYLSLMGTALNNGMVPVWSYWGGNVAWLDSPACANENPEVTGNFIFSNLIVGGSVISTTGPPVVPSVPVPPGSQVCGTTGCTTNLNWIEFNAPSGIQGISTDATVKCNNGQQYSCTWQGTKYGCAASGTTGGCPTITTVTVGGKPCILSASLAISDSTAETTFGSDQPLIIGLSVGIAVTIVVILVLIVVFFIRKQTGTYMETV